MGPTATSSSSSGPVRPRRRPAASTSMVAARPRRGRRLMACCVGLVIHQDRALAISLAVEAAAWLESQGHVARVPASDTRPSPPWRRGPSRTRPSRRDSTWSSASAATAPCCAASGLATRQPGAGARGQRGPSRLPRRRRPGGLEGGPDPLCSPGTTRSRSA